MRAEKHGISDIGGSESSYITDGSKGLKMIVRDIGTRLNKKVKFREAVYFSILGLYLIAFTVFSYVQIENIIKAYLESNETLFSLGDTLTKVDGQYRASLQVYSERSFLLNTLLYSELWSDRLNEQQKADRLAQSQFAYVTATTVFGTQYLLDFLDREVSRNLQSFSESIRMVSLNEKLSTVDASLRDLILRPKMSMKEYQDMTDSQVLEKFAPLVSFLLRFHGRLEKFGRNLKILHVSMNGKPPPYGLSPEVMQQNFLSAIPERFTELRNAFNGVLSYNERSLQLISELAVVREPKKFNIQILIYMVISLVLFLVFMAVFIHLHRRVRARLVEIFTQFRHLTTEEVCLHLETYSNRLNFLQTHKFDELRMMTLSLNISKRGTLHLRNAFIAQYNIKSSYVNNGYHASNPNREQKLTRQRRAEHISDNFRFSSTVQSFLIGSCVVALVLASTTFLLLSNSNMNSISNLIEFYSTTYQKFTSTSNFYLHHSIYMIYGNFIKINGEYPAVVMKDYEEKDQIRAMLTHLIENRSKFEYYFGKKGARTIDDVMFNSICSNLDTSKKTYSNDQKVCSDSLPANEGFVAFMSYERDVLKEIRDMVNADPDFLENSKKDFLLFPFQYYMFKDTSLRFRVSHKLVFETTFNLLMGIGQTNITEQLVAARNTLKYAGETVFYLSLMLIYLYFMVGTLRSVHHDLDVASETLANFIPEVIAQNKLIYRIFKDNYSEII